MKRMVLSVAVVCLLGIAPARAELGGLNGAARLGDAERIAVLLDQGLAVDGPGDGYSPLMFAAGEGHLAATELLLQRGADPAYRDHNGDRAMLWAARSGHAGTVALLLQAGDTADSPVDPYGQSPLFDAAFYGHEAVVRLLLGAGADPNRRDQTGDTPLHRAAATGALMVAEQLLAGGGDPNAKEEIFGRTPLHVAAGVDNPALLRLLIEQGGDIERGDRDGASALFNAADRGLPGNVEVLLRAGAVVDAVLGDGRTVFSTAVSSHEAGSGDFAATAMLLADNVEDLDGALAEAVWGGFGDVARKLAERGARADGVDHLGRPALAGAPMVAGLSTFELLLSLGADVRRDGAAALLSAADAGRADIVARLLDLGIDPDSSDADGRTPLHHAAKGGHVDVARLLVAAGAGRDPRDSAGLGVADAMREATSAIDMHISQRQASRAWRPTIELEAELAALTASHATILALLRG